MPLLLTAIVLMLVMAVGGVFASQVMRTGDAPEADTDTANMSYKVTLQSGLDNAKTDAIKNGVFTSSTAWCPGRTEIAYLTLTNNEFFPVEVDLSLVHINNGFDSYLDYALLLPGQTLKPHQHNAENWNAFETLAVANGAASKLPTSGTLPLLTDKTLNSGESYTFAFAIHMDEGTPDEYQNKSMYFEFGLTVTADYETGVDPTKVTVTETQSGK